ncbi:MAG: hypothetical protein AABZ15_03710 [Nitrospirota bacterium]
MNKRTIILLNILLLAVLLKLAFWADQRSFESQGVVRMLAGSDGTLFLLTNDEILHASQNGDLLANWPLAGMGITEPVADLAFGLEGQLLVGLIESQEIRRYTSEGKFVGTVPRPPSPERVGVPGQHLRNFKFTRDDRSGTLYVADSNHHRIQIYPSGGKEARVLTSPSGTRPVVMDEGEEGSEDEQPPAMDPHRPFRYPNSLSLDGDRLYATDTDNHRIIVFHLDGTLDRIIPTTRGARNMNIFPVHFGRMDDRLFVINRGPMFVGGEVVVLDSASPVSRPLYDRGLAIDPLDILVLGDDVLVADGETRNILRYSPGGYYLGFFGKPALQELLHGKERSYRGYLFLRVLAIGGMALVLIAFLVFKRSERQERTEQGLPDVHQPLPALQAFLGPLGSSRRTVLLWLVPGLGYIAAGRLLRAIILVPPLGFLVLLFIVLLVTVWGQGAMLLSVFMIQGIITAAYWTGVALDGMRLSEGEQRPEKKFDILALLKIAGLPFITVVAGAASQLVWELMKKSAPDIALPIEVFLNTSLKQLVGLSGQGGVLAISTPAGRFLGWAGAGAAVFGTISWKLGRGQVHIAASTGIGFLVGMLSWIFTALVPGSMPGGAYYTPLSQGLLVSLAVYLRFRGPLVSFGIVPVAVAFVWIGSVARLVLFMASARMLVGLPGADARIRAVVVEAFFIHAAILLMIAIQERRDGTRTDRDRIA